MYLQIALKLLGTGWIMLGKNLMAPHFMETRVHVEYTLVSVVMGKCRVL